MPFKFNPFSHKLDIVESGGGGTGILTLTGNSGGAVGPDVSNNVNIIGSGTITISGNAGTNTLTIGSSNPFITWTVISGSQMAVTQNGYFTNGVGVVEVQLPNASSVGDIFSVVDFGGNGWKITQGAGQQIIFGTSSSTLGASGFLQSLKVGDGVTLICVVDNLTWMVYPASGNITTS